ncbi:MAG: Membrane protein YdfJ [Calditrichaeota bacterium]|nr:Membrane protein YdfJ [Calditrichota bacterium]
MRREINRVREQPAPARVWAHNATRRPWWTLAGVLVVTVAALWIASDLELRLNFVDLLPEGHPVAERYKDVVTTYGEGSIVVAIEGARDRIVSFARDLAPRLRELDGVYQVQSRFPSEFFLEHGFALQDPDDFNRSLRIFSDPSLVGVFSGLNDDLEREYTDDEGNLRDDEVQVARNLLGINRSLELIERLLTGTADTTVADEACRAMLIGEPWLLSLDRRMLLVTVVPEEPSWRDTDAVIVLSREVDAVVRDLAADRPQITANLTGMGPIGVDEMESVGLYTELLMFAAWILVYLLLSRGFRSPGLPLLAMLPLLFGIIWSMGLDTLLFGTLNMMTVMLGLVLIGLGIDFTLHLISRYAEERGNGIELEEALARMLGGTGKGVLTGSLTTAAAFFSLMIADTVGVFEFGAAAGTGVLLTVLAVFVTLPSLLVIRERRYLKRGRVVRLPPRAGEGWPAIGHVAGFTWRGAAVVLPLFLIVAVAAVWAAREIQFEYNFLKLEPKGLASVELQRVIPERFGISDQAAWVEAETVAESRRLKERFEDLAMVGEVNAISDYLTVPERVETYGPALRRYRERIARTHVPAPPSPARLASEIDRLWDNLDAISNLAFIGGIERVWPAIDNITGYDNETNTTDTTAVLPSLLRALQREGVQRNVAASSRAWFAAMKPALLTIASDEPVALEEIPQFARKAHTPMRGDRPFVVRLAPRRSLWERDDLERFNEQAKSVTPEVVSTAELFILMTDETLIDGRDGALLALAVIVILLLLHFRGPFGLIATVPLAGSALFMLGTMYLVGMKYNYINLIAVPIILGIGIDDGVHALHRYREIAGEHTVRVREAFSRAGRAILLTSMTTMIGFGAIGFYTMRGMASFGVVLFMGVGYCFVATVIVLPAVLRLVARTRKSR